MACCMVLHCTRKAASHLNSPPDCNLQIVLSMPVAASRTIGSGRTPQITSKVHTKETQTLWQGAQGEVLQDMAPHSVLKF